MNAVEKYPNVIRALEKLASLFTCDNCKTSLHHPISLGTTCDHILCLQCAPTLENGPSSKKVNKCVVCNLPSRAKDRKEMKQYSDVLAITRSMLSIIKETSPEEMRTEDIVVPIPVDKQNDEDTAPEENEMDRSTVKDNSSMDQTAVSEIEEKNHTIEPEDPRAKPRKSVKNTPKTIDKVGQSTRRSSLKRKLPNTDGPSSPPAPQITFKKARLDSKSKVSSVTSTDEKPNINFKTKVKTKPDTPRVTLVRFLPSHIAGSVTSTPSKKSVHGAASPGPLIRRNLKGETPLHQAVISGNLELVTKLLNDNPPHPVNVVDNVGWTPLHEAVNGGFVPIAELLLKHGANINQPGGDERITPLMDAVENGQIECVRLLREYGADVNLRNLAGKTADMLITPSHTPALIAALRETKVNRKKILSINNRDVDLDYSINDGVSAMHVSGPSSSITTPHILCSRLNRSQREQVQRVTQLLGGTIVELKDGVLPSKLTHVITICMGDEDNVTDKEGQKTPVKEHNQYDHLVTGRTIKYLLGVAQGAWIVSYNWISLCAHYGRYVEELPFEVSGDSSLPLSLVERRVPHLARITRWQEGKPGLFSGCQFYFHGGFQSPSPSRNELISLVKAADGIHHTRELRPDNISSFKQTVPFYANNDDSVAKEQKSKAAKSAHHPLRNCGFFVIYQTPPKEIYSTDHLRSVSFTWLMQCMGQFELLAPDL